MIISFLKRVRIALVGYTYNEKAKMIEEDSKERDRIHACSNRHVRDNIDADIRIMDNLAREFSSHLKALKNLKLDDPDFDFKRKRLELRMEGIADRINKHESWVNHFMGKLVNEK